MLNCDRAVTRKWFASRTSKRSPTRRARHVTSCADTDWRNAANPLPVCVARVVCVPQVVVVVIAFATCCWVGVWGGRQRGAGRSMAAGVFRAWLGM